MPNFFKISLIFFLAIVNNTNAQNYSQQKKIPVQAQQIAVDHFDYIYIVESYKISKYNKKGNLLYSYEQIENGPISLFDISDPLKPLVFYKNFNSIAILDNKLALINTINLFEQNTNLISLVCAASSQEYWVYDQEENRLKKLDLNFKLINQSELFISLFKKIETPYRLKIKDNILYLLNKESIILFDFFGSYLKTISIKDITDFQILNKKLIYLENQVLKSYNPISFETDSMLLPQVKEKVFNAKILKDQLILQTKKAVYFFEEN